MNIDNQLSNLGAARASAEKVFELLDEERVDVASGEIRSVRYRGHVRFEDVLFGYILNEDVLNVNSLWNWGRGSEVFVERIIIKKIRII